MFNEHKSKIFIVAAFIAGLLISYFNPFVMFKQEIPEVAINIINNYTIGDTLYLDGVLGDLNDVIEEKEIEVALLEAEKEKYHSGISTYNEESRKFLFEFDMSEIKEDFGVYIMYRNKIFPLINNIQLQHNFDVAKIRTSVKNDFLLSYDVKDLLMLDNYNQRIEFPVTVSKIYAMIQDYTFDSINQTMYISVLQEKTNAGNEHIAFLNDKEKHLEFSEYQDYYNDKYVKTTYKVIVSDVTEEIVMYIKITNVDIEADAQNPAIVRFSLKSENNRL